MNAFLLAFSLIRVPKLFISLLFWPMMIGIFVALTQISFSSAYFELATETPDEYKERILSVSQDKKWINKLVLGIEPASEEITVCRWQLKNGVEVPPDASCIIGPYEVSVRSESPEVADVSKFVTLFEGAVAKLHVCRNCRADIVVEQNKSEILSNVYSWRALGVFMLIDMETTARLNQHFVTAREKLEEIKDSQGIILLHPAGFAEPINITQTTKTMVLIINAALITIITLWLALKGHRKVLDYFARNRALLPLVAACGKNTFYASLWIITLLRVFFFLLAVIPSTILVLNKTVPEETMDVFIRSKPQFLLWLFGMVASLSSLTIIASIADLKQRHSFVGFLYRYVPLMISLIGTSLWFAFLFQLGSLSYYAQNFIAALPVLGTNSLLLSPLFPMSNTLIAVHAILSAVLVLLILHRNSRWFAAHLEEI